MFFCLVNFFVISYFGSFGNQAENDHVNALLMNKVKEKERKKSEIFNLGQVWLHENVNHLSELRNVM